MIRRGKQHIRSYMTLVYEFTGIRMQDGYMMPVDWTLGVSLIISEKKGKSRDELELKASKVYHKIYFWLDTNLPNIIAVDVNSEEDLLIANLSSNIMMYCPDSPTDNLIIELLHAKMTALAGDDLIIGGIKLQASDSNLEYIFDTSDGTYSMPETTEEYYTEGKARDETPWWFRDDGFCFEFIRPDDIELTDEELFKDITDPLDEFYRRLEESIDETTGTIKEPARIVQVEKWKPKKVE
jgi:hypothetical protein